MMQQFLFVIFICLLASCGDATSLPATTTPIVAETTTLTPPPTTTSNNNNIISTDWPLLPTDDLTVPTGYQASLLLEGLSGPTQMIIGPDNGLWLGQLAGGEREGVGQVIRVSPVTGEQIIVLENLLKPTGIAILSGHLWVATQQDLIRAPLKADFSVGPVEVVVADIPFNGRSNGTLTVTPQGTLLYESSGRRSQATHSGLLWQLDPTDPTNPQPLAFGLKGAYAHIVDENGRIWTTEIGDDPISDGQAPPDELNLIMEGAHYGWPQCYGQQEVATNYGGTNQFCQTTQAPIALFPPHSTPTSLALSPWQADTLLVALWQDKTVSQVTITPNSQQLIGQPETFITGFQSPQHLLTLADGNLLVSDHVAGKVYHLASTMATQ